ncbi:hypothetical protein BV20DRAFT_1057318 [Pilatotrama ljubarskyi]|nr:hypothetical protein BV20DRAFT_1057318 [Pilatotrama ljubarskyi]
MAGVSFEIPLNVRDTIPEQFSNQLRLCPAETHGRNQHVLFAPDGLFPHRSRTIAFEDGAGNIEEWVAVDPVDETTGGGSWDGSLVWSSIKRPTSYSGSSTPTLPPALPSLFPTHSTKGHSGGMSV